MRSSNKISRNQPKTAKELLADFYSFYLATAAPAAKLTDICHFDFKGLDISEALLEDIQLIIAKKHPNFEVMHLIELILGTRIYPDFMPRQFKPILDDLASGKLPIAQELSNFFLKKLDIKETILNGLEKFFEHGVASHAVWSFTSDRKFFLQLKDNNILLLNKLFSDHLAAHEVKYMDNDKCIYLELFAARVQTRSATPRFSHDLLNTSNGVL